MNLRALHLLALGVVTLASAGAETVRPAAAASAGGAAIVEPAASGAPFGASGLATLRHDLDAMLATDPAVRGAHVGVFAVSTQTGTVLYDRLGSDAFQPASTMKLIVGSAALDRLGPAFRFHTSLAPVTVSAADAPVALVLKGGGDPFLSARDLTAAAAAVRAAAVSSAGEVHVDDSRYSTAAYPRGWVWDDFAQDYAPHVSAATLEENVAHLHVAPGDEAGAAAVVSAEAHVAVDSQPAGDCLDVATRPGVVVRSFATTAGRATKSTLDVTTDRFGCPTVIGHVALGADSESIDVAVASPVTYLWSVLAADLGLPAPPAAPADRAFAAYVRTLPAGATTGHALWSHDSDPLALWLGKRFWIPSDNLVAETLLCELGAATGGLPGSTEKGATAERAWLRAAGIDAAPLTIADGSGLSQYDRITPRTLVAILQHDWNGAHRDVVLASLPVGGARGTIEGIAGTPAAGRVFAKTGSMSHVRGLAGYLATVRHGAVTFAFSVDDWNGDYFALAALRARVLSRIVTD